MIQRVIIFDLGFHLHWSSACQSLAIYNYYNDGKGGRNKDRCG